MGASASNSTENRLRDQHLLFDSQHSFEHEHALHQRAEHAHTKAEGKKKEQQHLKHALKPVIIPTGPMLNQQSITVKISQQQEERRRRAGTTILRYYLSST